MFLAGKKQNKKNVTLFMYKAQVNLKTDKYTCGIKIDWGREREQ